MPFEGFFDIRVQPQIIRHHVTQIIDIMAYLSWLFRQITAANHNFTQPSSTQGRSESRCFSYPGRGLPLRNNDGADIAVFAVFDPLVILRRIGGSAGVIHKSARLHFIFAGS